MAKVFVVLDLSFSVSAKLINSEFLDRVLHDKLEENDTIVELSMRRPSDNIDVGGVLLWLFRSGLKQGEMSASLSGSSVVFLIKGIYSIDIQKNYLDMALDPTSIWSLGLSPKIRKNGDGPIEGGLEALRFEPLGGVEKKKFKRIYYKDEVELNCVNIGVFKTISDAKRFVVNQS